MDESIQRTQITYHFVSFLYFRTQIFRHDDLKQMLDSNKDHLKLEAMKRVIGMVAKVCIYMVTVQANDE